MVCRENILNEPKSVSIICGYLEKLFIRKFQRIRKRGLTLVTLPNLTQKNTLVGDFLELAVIFLIPAVLVQLIFTCSKLTIETLKKVWNMFKVNNKITRTMSLMSLLLTLNIFQTFFSCFQLKAVDYFCLKLYVRCLEVSDTRLHCRPKEITKYKLFSLFRIIWLEVKISCGKKEIEKTTIR